MHRSILAAVAALGVGVATLAPFAAPSVASTPAEGDLPAVQEAHFDIIAKISELDALAAEHRMGTVAGDPEAGTIDVGWVGDVPGDVQRIADDAAIDGIDVRFVPQAASAAALTEVAQGVAASLPVEGAFGVQIGDEGLTVEVPTEEAAEAAGDVAIPLDDAGVQRVLERAESDAAALGVDLVVERTDDVPLSAARVDPAGRAPIQTGRTDDRTELSGGMRVLTQFRSGAFVSCTSGFTGVQGHRPFILTAAHCSDYMDSRAVRNYAGAGIGTSDLVAELNDGARSTDLGIIALDYEARTLPRIYQSQTGTVPITSAMTTAPPSGYYLCSSGQVTGWKCDLRAGAPYVACYSSSAGSECMNVQLVTSSTGRAFCLGDSGGPVVSHPNGDGATAVAVVSGIRGTPVNGCGPTGLIAPVADLFSTVWGTQLHTTPIGSTSGAPDPAVLRSLLDSINAERRTAGQAPLAIDTCLSGVAGRWAATMARDSLAGSAHNPTLDADMRACAARGWGENVGRTMTTNPDPTSMMRTWMASTGHRNNILNATFTHIGIGVERGSNGSWYYVLDFARR